MSENKNERFKRLAQLRGERVLHDLGLLSNLSNRNNYEYSDEQVRALFGAIEEELKIAKASFARKTKRGISL
jgi:hypothetical protein